MLIDETHEISKTPAAEAAPAGSTPSPVEIRSTLGSGEKDAPEKDDKPSEKSAEKQDDDLDEELDDSFPASDPPSQTQP